MRTISVVFILALISGEGFCQAESALPNQIRASQTMDNISRLQTGEVLYGIPQPEGKVIGDTYLNTNWLKSTIMLYEKEKLLEGYPVRYDIGLDELEIKGSKGVKVLRGDKVKSFVMLDSITQKPLFYINAKEFKNEDGVKLMGFYQVLSDGTKPLFKKTSIKVKKGNYNVQFDVGSRDDKLLRKYDYFTTDGDKVAKIPSSHKKLFLVFGDKSKEMEDFVDANKLSAKNEHHLRAIFDHYNQLIQKSQS